MVVLAVVVQHVEDCVGKESSASHGLMGQLHLRKVQLLWHTVTAAFQQIQTQLTAQNYRHHGG